MTEKNPWTELLPDAGDFQAIATLSRAQPNPVLDLARLSGTQMATVLESAFRQIFVPTAQTTSILSTLLGEVHTHIHTFYHEPRKFMESAYSHEYDLPDELHAWCITGLGGIGKSQLMHALQRLVGRADALMVDEYHEPFQFLPVRSGPHRCAEQRAQRVNAALAQRPRTGRRVQNSSD